MNTSSGYQTRKCTIVSNEPEMTFSYLTVRTRLSEPDRSSPVKRMSQPRATATSGSEVEQMSVLSSHLCDTSSSWFSRAARTVTRPLASCSKPPIAGILKSSILSEIANIPRIGRSLEILNNIPNSESKDRSASFIVDSFRLSTRQGSGPIFPPEKISPFVFVSSFTIALTRVLRLYSTSLRTKKCIVATCMSPTYAGWSVLNRKSDLSYVIFFLKTRANCLSSSILTYEPSSKALVHVTELNESDITAGSYAIVTVPRSTTSSPDI